MPVIGFTINGIEGKRLEGFTNSKIGINSAPTINSIKEVPLDDLGKKALVMDFDFHIEYTPNIGHIKIKGEIVYLAQDNKKILDEWEKGKTMPAEASVEVLNFMFRRCLIKGLQLADDLQLPSPVSMPMLTAQKTEGAQKGHSHTTDDLDAKEKELKEKIKKLTSK